MGYTKKKDNISRDKIYSRYQIIVLIPFLSPKVFKKYIFNSIRRYPVQTKSHSKQNVYTWILEIEGETWLYHDKDRKREFTFTFTM